MIKPPGPAKSVRTTSRPGNRSDEPLEVPTLPLAELVRKGYDFSELAAFVRAHDPAWVSKEVVPDETSEKKHVLPRRRR